MSKPLFSFLVLSFLLIVSARAQTSIYGVFEGDSTTHGNGTYPSNVTFFLTSLAAGHVPAIIFTNIAISGDTASNNATATDTLTHLTNSPAGAGLIASVYLGLNDVYFFTNPPSYTESNLLSWVTNVRASFPQVRILMHTLWRRQAESSTVISNRGVINTWIRSSAPVDLVVDNAADDQFNVLLHPENFVDNVHLSIAGNQYWASNIWNLLAVTNWFFPFPANINVGTATVGTLRTAP